MSLVAMAAVLSGFIGVWFFAAWLACAFFAGHVASEKARCGFCWFCWGILFGPVALVASVGLPDDRQTQTAHDPDAERQWITTRLEPKPLNSAVSAVSGLIIFGLLMYFFAR